MDIFDFREYQQRLTSDKINKPLLFFTVKSAIGQEASFSY